MIRLAMIAYTVYALVAIGYVILAVLLGTRIKDMVKRHARRRAERDADRGWTAEDEARMVAWARDRG